MKYSPPKSSMFIPLEFRRPFEGPRFASQVTRRSIPESNEPGWISNGGPRSGHPDRAREQLLGVLIPERPGNLVRIFLNGIFARWAEVEDTGEAGACIELWNDIDCLFRFSLVNDRHYKAASDLGERCLVSGDGASVETLGSCEIDGQTVRVDCLTIDIPSGPTPTRLVFRDMGSAASFILFDIAVEYQTEPGCPFRAKSGGISLSELGAAIRVGDRSKLEKALLQLDEAMETAKTNLDEARGMALAFLGVVCSASIELGASRQVHFVPLAAAREVDGLSTGAEIGSAIRGWVQMCLADVLDQGHGLSKHLMDRAMGLIDRNFAKDIADADVAAKLGLSTSHFRALFKQATGQPFHRYLISVRLERAKQLLLEQGMPVGEVAESVGFGALSHFSRAFAQRFKTSPTALRRIGRKS